MVTCNDCFHYKICRIVCRNGDDRVLENSPCKYFKNEADYEEVKHAEWIEEVVKIPCAWDEGGYEIQIDYVCSECGFVNNLEKTNGCPECRAKMDGRSKEL